MTANLTVEEFARISGDFQRLGHIGFEDTKRLIAAAGDWIADERNHNPSSDNGICDGRLCWETNEMTDLTVEELDRLEKQLEEVRYSSRAPTVLPAVLDKLIAAARKGIEAEGDRDQAMKNCEQAWAQIEDQIPEIARLSLEVGRLREALHDLVWVLENNKHTETLDILSTDSFRRARAALGEGSRR